MTEARDKSSAKADPIEGDTPERRELDPETYRLSGVLNVDRDGVQLVIDDRFIVLEELGRGGYGAVYKAFDESYGRYVAIKQMLPPRPDDASGPVKREGENVRELRLQKEMQIMANLQHPNIVHVHEYINHTDTPDGKYSYIVMELLDGESLYALTRRLGRLPVSLAVEVGLQLTNVIAFIHKNGYIHRDLKPENIIVLNEEAYGLSGCHIKLLDFGLAIYKEAEQRLTESGFIGGTVWYLSPEQCEGADADEQSDLYGIGVMLFEMLTGELPYGGGTHNERLVQKLRHNYSKMALLTDRPDIPDVLKRFVERALAVPKAERFASAKAMNVALEGISSVLPPDVSPSEVGEPMPVVPYEVAAAIHLTAPPGTRRVKRGRLNLVLVIAILGVLAVAAVGFALTWDQEPSGAAVPQMLGSIPDGGSGEADVAIDSARADVGLDAAPRRSVVRRDGRRRPTPVDAGTSTPAKKPPRVLSLPGIQRERGRHRKTPRR